MLNPNFHRHETEEFDDILTSMHSAQLTPWEDNQATTRLTFDANDWLPDNFIPRLEFPFGQMESEEIDLTSNPMVQELLQLQREQEEIEEQIRLLHLAHEELDEARNELMELLMHIDEDTGLDEINIDEFIEPPTRLVSHVVDLENDDDEDDDADEEGIDFDELSENVGLGIDNDSFIRTSNGPHEDFRMTFLDENGDECNGLTETMQNAIGWVNSKTRCILENTDRDANGNEFWQSPPNRIYFEDYQR